MPHFYVDQTAVYASRLRTMLNNNETADDQIADVLDNMTQMLTGDGTADAHYSIMKLRYGFATDADARAAYGEITSAASKTSGNGSVINVRAARDQMYSRLR